MLPRGMLTMVRSIPGGMAADPHGLGSRPCQPGHHWPDRLNLMSWSTPVTANSRPHIRADRLDRLFADAALTIAAMAREIEVEMVAVVGVGART